jgi:hypothetical protein
MFFDEPRRQSIGRVLIGAGAKRYDCGHFSQSLKE